MSAVAPVLPGETLGAGKYRVERILGQGGMGIVVAAKHIELDERVAIKFLLGEPGVTALDRFLREARAAAKVKGEHVCRVLDFGRLETGEPYIVMEYLDGVDLSKVIERSGAQEASSAVGWIVEACDALIEAHALGIVHRDVKPANIFLAKRGDESVVAKVLDFGISKLPSQRTQMTGTLTSMGSPIYMSPEQMESARDVDGRADVWSLGVSLYELLAGKPPFTADSMVQLTVMVREKEPPPLIGVSDALASVVKKCLAKAPDERYQTVRALLADLEPFAPEYVIGILRRHARRDSIPGGDPALAATSLETRSDEERRGAARGPDTASGELSESHSDNASKKAIGKGTFAPLQSTLDESAVLRERRRRPSATLSIGVAVVLALAVFGAITLRSSAPTMQTPTPSAVPEAAISPIPSVTSSATTGAALGALAPSSASATPAMNPSPAPSARIVRISATPPAAPSTSAAVAETAAPTPTASTSAASALPPSKPEPKKRRELDRDDP